MFQTTHGSEPYSKIFPPIHVPLHTPEEFANGQQTVTMAFPQRVVLTVGEGFERTYVLFPEGIHEVPKEYSDHWFLIAHGAQVVD